MQDDVVNYKKRKRKRKPYFLEFRWKRRVWGRRGWHKYWKKYRTEADRQKAYEALKNNIVIDVRIPHKEGIKDGKIPETEGMGVVQ